jgi:hypothetical protein
MVSAHEHSFPAVVRLAPLPGVSAITRTSKTAASASRDP